MRLTLNTREVGRVMIVRCTGRIVAGPEAESLGAHLENLLRERKAVVLHLGEVDFLDSSGPGTMVRSLTSARRLHDLKLCKVPESIHKVLKMTHLNKLFDTHDSEEGAIAEFQRLIGSWEKLTITGPCVLCIDQNANVLAYLRELLRRAGYQAYTSANLHDSLMVMRVSPPRLLLLGPDLTALPETKEAFELACAKIPVIELGKEFCMLDAGEAAEGLLGKIEARLHPTAFMPS